MKKHPFQWFCSNLSDSYIIKVFPPFYNKQNAPRDKKLTTRDNLSEIYTFPAIRQDGAESVRPPLCGEKQTGVPVCFSLRFYLFATDKARYTSMIRPTRGLSAWKPV